MAKESMTSWKPPFMPNFTSGTWNGPQKNIQTVAPLKRKKRVLTPIWSFQAETGPKTPELVGNRLSRSILHEWATEVQRSSFSSPKRQEARS